MFIKPDYLELSAEYQSSLIELAKELKEDYGRQITKDNALATAEEDPGCCVEIVKLFPELAADIAKIYPEFVADIAEAAPEAIEEIIQVLPDSAKEIVMAWAMSNFYKRFVSKPAGRRSDIIG